jgi:hypothetical protein
MTRLSVAAAIAAVVVFMTVFVTKLIANRQHVRKLQAAKAVS